MFKDCFINLNMQGIFLTSITVSKMLVTDNFKEKMFKDQNA